MKKLILSAVFVLSLVTFNATAQKKSSAKSVEKEQVKITIDLNQVKDDKVMVTITPPKFT